MKSGCGCTSMADAGRHRAASDSSRPASGAFSIALPCHERLARDEADTGDKKESAQSALLKSMKN